MKGDGTAKLILTLCVILAILVILIVRVLRFAAGMTKAAVFLFGLILLILFMVIRPRK